PSRCRRSAPCPSGYPTAVADRSTDWCDRTWPEVSRSRSWHHRHAARHRPGRGKFLPGAVGDVARREWRPGNELSVALLGAQFAILPSDAAAGQRDARRAGAGDAFEHVVIDAAGLGLGRDGLGPGRIPDHEIRVGADRDGALARID